MPLRDHDWFFTSGKGQRVGFTNAQCSAYGAPSATHRVSVGLSARAKGSQAIVQPVKTSCEKKRYIDGPLIHAASFASRVCQAIPGLPCGEAEVEVIRRNPLPRL